MARTRSPRGLPWLCAGLALLSAGLLVAYLSERGVDSGEVGAYLAEQSPRAGRTAARVARLLTNYDAGGLEDNTRALLGLTTGTLRRDVGELLPRLAPALERAGGSTRGEIVSGPDVAFTSATQAVAFVTVRQTSTTGSERSRRLLTMQLSLVRSAEGTWRADAFRLRGSRSLD